MSKCRFNNHECWQSFLRTLVLGSANTTEHSVKSKVDLFEAKAKDDASPQKVNEVENQTILEKPVVPNVEEELVPTIKPEANQGVYSFKVLFSQNSLN